MVVLPTRSFFVCFSTALFLTSPRLGIECAYLIGQCHDGEYHAWNLVKLEGNYYHTDVTWDDSSKTDKNPGGGKGEIFYQYFCITTEEIKRSRNIDMENLIPVCKAVKCNYYHRSGLYFTEYNLNKITAAVAPQLRRGEKRFSIKFKTKALYDIAKKKLHQDGGIWSIYKACGISSTGSCMYSDDCLNILTFCIK